MLAVIRLAYYCLYCTMGDSICHENIHFSYTGAQIRKG